MHLELLAQQRGDRPGRHELRLVGQVAIGDLVLRREVDDEELASEALEVLLDPAQVGRDVGGTGQRFPSPHEPARQRVVETAPAHRLGDAGLDESLELCGACFPRPRVAGVGNRGEVEKGTLHPAAWDSLPSPQPAEDVDEPWLPATGELWPQGGLELSRVEGERDEIVGVEHQDHGLRPEQRNRVANQGEVGLEVAAADAQIEGLQAKASLLRQASEYRGDRVLRVRGKTLDEAVADEGHAGRAVSGAQRPGAIAEAVEIESVDEVHAVGVRDPAERSMAERRGGIVPRRAEQRRVLVTLEVRRLGKRKHCAQQNLLEREEEQQREREARGQGGQEAHGYYSQVTSIGFLSTARRYLSFG